MSMPEKIYHALNRAFSDARNAEEEAARLEAEAEAIRDRAMRTVQEAYDLLNRATVTLNPKDA